MSKKNVYRDIQASLIRFCRDFGDLHNLGFVNLDAHTEPETWPDQDFIGIGELNVDISDTDEVTLSFAMSTKDDAYLLRMSELINHLLNELLPGSSIPLLDAETGEQFALLMITDGVRVGPPLKTESQPLQPIMVRMLSNFPHRP